jgi:Site-specific recombinase XerD
MEEEINAYGRYLRIERGLSDNTITSYQRDLRKYSHFLEKNEIHAFGDVTKPDVLLYLQFLNEEKLATASIGRMITSLRKFHQYLKQEGLIENDPMVTIQLPKKQQKLPKVLSMDEIERLMAAPDVKTVLGLRDRAILELLYATGLRVSELIHITMRKSIWISGSSKQSGRAIKKELFRWGRKLPSGFRNICRTVDQLWLTEGKRRLICS